MSGFDSPTLDATVAEIEAHEAAAEAKRTPKPCPFCGCEVEGGLRFARTEGSARWQQAECHECGARGPEVRVGLGGPDEDGAERLLVAWNRREA